MSVSFLANGCSRCILELRDRVEVLEAAAKTAALPVLKEGSALLLSEDAFQALEAAGCRAPDAPAGGGLTVEQLAECLPGNAWQGPEGYSRRFFAEHLLSHPITGPRLRTEPTPAAAPAGGVTEGELAGIMREMPGMDCRGEAAWLLQHPRIGPLLRGEGAPVQSPDPHEALAARPLLEQVAHLADRIGQHTVSEITVISDRAAAWLAENPPGRPVAIEPRGCPTPGSCSCVEPPAPAPAADGEREELARWLYCLADQRSCNRRRGIHPHPSTLTRAAALLREAHPQPVPGWQPIDTAPQDGTEILASDYDVVEILSWSWDAWEAGSGWIDRNGQRLFPARWQPLPDHPPIPQPPQGGEVEA